ncbi:MAG TPA: hypothetical protein VHV83_17090, partial [Armatimonadota bacterium]|nr:hypothetical protein [Armatimonadota bacterium]
ALAFGSIGLTIGLHLAINHWAPLRRLLYGSPLSMLDYAVVLGAALLPTSLAMARHYPENTTLAKPDTAHTLPVAADDHTITAY